MQGPPGTGKTKTILALLSIVLHSAPKGSAGLTRYTPRSSPRPPPDASAFKRLWRLSSPWFFGLPNPRSPPALPICVHQKSMCHTMMHGIRSCHHSN